MHGPALLVIEDLEDQAVLVGIAARRAHPGLDVHTAGNGHEGISYLEAALEAKPGYPVPNLVILDLYMPDADGFTVLEWAQQQGSKFDTPIVVLTASPSVQDEIRALEQGARAVLKKPAHVSELGETVREIVEEWIGRGEIISAHIWEMG